MSDFHITESADETVARSQADTGASESEDSIDLIEVAAKLWAGRRFIGIFAGTAALLSVCLAFILPVYYTAEASFVPPSVSSSSGLSALYGQLSSIGIPGMLGSIKSPGDLYAGILHSHEVARQLIKRFNLLAVYDVKKESQAERILDANTAIKVGAKDSIVYISVTDRDGARARDLANGYLDALAAANNKMALTSAGQQRLFYEKQLVVEKNALANAEVDLRKAQENTGMIEPTGQTKVQLETIAKTRAEIASREVQLAAMRQAATEENPEVIRIRSEISDLRSQLRSLQSGTESNGNLPTSRVPEVALEYIRKQREVKYHESLFELLSRQYEAARLQEAKETEEFQVLDRAVLPDTKSSPKRTLIVAGGLLLGTFMGMVFVLIRSGNHLETIADRLRAHHNVA